MTEFIGTPEQLKEIRKALSKFLKFKPQITENPTEIWSAINVTVEFDEQGFTEFANAMVKAVQEKEIKRLRWLLRGAVGALGKIATGDHNNIEGMSDQHYAKNLLLCSRDLRDFLPSHTLGTLSIDSVSFLETAVSQSYAFVSSRTAEENQTPQGGTSMNTKTSLYHPAMGDTEVELELAPTGKIDAVKIVRHKREELIVFPSGNQESGPKM